MMRGIFCVSCVNKDTDHLHGYFHAADLNLCFHIYAKSKFSHDVAHIKSRSRQHKTRCRWFAW